MPETREQVREKACGCFEAGFYCAESVSRTIIELFADDASSYSSTVASGFSGGIGGSHLETCGALSGGVIAFGFLYGRTDPKVVLRGSILYDLVTEFRRRFVDEFGSSNCGSILQAFGEQNDWHKCKELTARTAEIVYDILTEKAEVIRIARQGSVL